jgi:hypothetical protein
VTGVDESDRGAADRESVLAELDDRLLEHGLFVRGVTRLNDDEIETYGLDPASPGLALVGNIGSSYWPRFSRAPEFGDGMTDPLDRWSRRVAAEMARDLSLQPLFPFEGPPYYPFQQWARRAEGLEQSPIGVLMHPEFGLWHSYRFALYGVDSDSRQPAPAAISPCRDCDAKPCLHSCPVEAFDGNSYDVDRCAGYLRRHAEAECNRRGCQARYACPVAPGLRYIDAQGSFHLHAFLAVHAAAE